MQIFRARVLAEGALTAEVMDRIDAEVAEAVHQAVETALAAPVPDLSELLTDVYVSY